MYLDLLGIIRAELSFEEDVFVKDYTAKLVKTLLVSGNQRLAEVFERDYGFPKLIHITPFFQFKLGANGRVEVVAVYSKYVSRGKFIKPKNLSERLKPVKIRSGERYVFYVGVMRELLPEVLNALASADKLVFGATSIVIKHLSYEVKYVNLEDEVENVAGKIASDNVNCVKVVFESPTMLKDPLVFTRKRKRKLFVPIPEAVFSTPIYITLIGEGKLKYTTYMKALMCVKSVLDMPYSIIRDVSVAWLVYRNKPIPGLIGYAKYYLDRTALAIAQEKMKKSNIDFMKTLAKAVILMGVLGTGTGRATGFGHVSVEITKR